MRQLEYSFASGILKMRWILFVWVTRRVSIDDILSIKEATHHSDLALTQNEARNIPSDKEETGGENQRNKEHTNSVRSIVAQTAVIAPRVRGRKKFNGEDTQDEVSSTHRFEWLLAARDVDKQNYRCVSKWNKAVNEFSLLETPDDSGSVLTSGNFSH